MSVRQPRLFIVMSAAIGMLAACHRQQASTTTPTPVSDGRSSGAPSAVNTDPASGGRSSRPDGEREAMEARRTLEAKIYFDFDRWELSAESRQILEAKLGLLRANSALRLVVEGNADDKGSDEYNLALGQRRAAAVKQFFVQREIDTGRIDIVSYGEQRPACTATTDPCRAQNRRAEFRVAAGM